MGTPLRLLQANINHSARAQDLLLQSMLEWQIDAVVAAEPYYVSDRPNWAGDSDGTVAIIVPDNISAAPLSVTDRGEGFVAVSWRGNTLIGIYYSPNRPLSEFERFLDRVGAAVRRAMPAPVIVLGDFNAKSAAWGSPDTDARGEAVEEWAAVYGLVLLNRGAVNTCVRQQGGSIVDLSFTTPAVSRRVADWRVMEEVETLSDHLYIRMDLSSSSDVTTTTAMARQAGQHPFPRWSVAQMNRDLLKEASIVQAWAMSSEPTEVDEGAHRLRSALTQVCDAAMPRVRRRPPRRAVYWWTPEISGLREECSAARRRYTHYRRRRLLRNEASYEVEKQLHEVYLTAKKSLQRAIAQSKDEGRREMVRQLDNDPWGRPYRAARNKLRAQAPPLTETMEPQLLENVVSTLFPDRPAHTPPVMVQQGRDDDEVEEEVPAVTLTEVEAVAEKLRLKKTAPGPDGVPGRALSLALSALAENLMGLFNLCLTAGRFPTCWKEGRLVLLRKEGRPAESPSAYRPIVLLDEVGKLFERLLAFRIVRHLTEVGPDLDEQQYGFRVGRSTIDAIKKVRALSEEAVEEGDVLLAVSLDIANAFNTLPFSCIEEAMRYHGLPLYLQRIIRDYLQVRDIVYPAVDGIIYRRRMTCGVPQGSVLGPLLWNIGYDWILRGHLRRGLSVVCYADDTLMTARGRDYEQAVSRASVGVSEIVGRIERLGLKVALNKTEVLSFHGPRRAPPAGINIEVGGERIEVKPTIKYLGLVLDGRWSFREHFRLLASKLIKTAGALGRLLPNTGGPNITCRRLYTGVVRSMALYGAPVWADTLSAPNEAQLRKAQRIMATRVIRGYRTISYEAACVLAGTPPWDLDARVLAAVYENTRRAGPQMEIRERLRRRQLDIMLRRWSARLASPSAGHRTVEAFRPILKEWVDRRHGSLTFRLVQILSGHGCFGRYLCHIAGREPLPTCHECLSAEDTAQHTLESCTQWTSERATLVSVIGRDLTLPAVVRAMLSSKGHWEAVVSFCEIVMSQKEAAERVREEDPNSASIRRQRTGRRRRDYARLPMQ